MLTQLQETVLFAFHHRPVGFPSWMDSQHVLSVLKERGIEPCWRNRDSIDRALGQLKRKGLLVGARYGTYQLWALVESAEGYGPTPDERRAGCLGYAPVPPGVGTS